jgi:lipopolysaccharide transport system permease protein
VVVSHFFGQAGGTVSLNASTLGRLREGRFFDLLARHRWLIWEMTKREHSDRYAGSMFGSLWAVGHPLALMAVYVVVFSYVFKLRIGGTQELPLDYTTYLIAGYLPWMAFQESMSKACVAISGNANLVKQVVFPLEVLPVKGTLAAVLTQLVGTGFLAVYTLLIHGPVPATYLLFPFLLGFQLLAMIGVSLGLAAVGAYLRDLKELVQVGSMVGVYLMPIFYLPSWVPEALRPVLYINPFSYMIWCYQDVFYFGRIEHPWSWIIFSTASLLVFQLGKALFGKTKTYFGNVL